MCLSVAKKYLGASIFDCVCSTRPTVRVHMSSIAESRGPEAWRRGYYGRGAEKWQTDPQPLQPGESGHLFKSMDAQCAAASPSESGTWSLHERRKRCRQINTDRSSSSSSSGSSTDSDGSSVSMRKRSAVLGDKVKPQKNVTRLENEEGTPRQLHYLLNMDCSSNNQAEDPQILKKIFF